MKTNELIREIERLPFSKQIYVIEKAIQEIRKLEEMDRMKEAAELMHSDYIADEELTIFTKLDFENFYETK